MHGIARHSIIFQRADAGPCVICTKPVGHGPIGWHYTKGALCDVCFLDEHQHLGLTLLMTNLLREFGRRPVRHKRDERELGAALMDSARLYHRASLKVWLPRRVEFLAELQGSLEHLGGPDV